MQSEQAACLAGSVPAWPRAHAGLFLQAMDAHAPPPVDAVPRPRLGRIFHDTLSGYLRALPVGLRRFWLLVPLTGVIAGLGAVASVHVLALVQRLAWGPHDVLLDATRAATPERRFLVPLAAGALVVAAGALPPGGGGRGASPLPGAR